MRRGKVAGIPVLNEDGSLNGQIIGYSSPVKDVNNMEMSTLGIDASGNVVHDELGESPEAAQAATQAAGEGGQVQVIPTAEAARLRAERHQADLESLSQPSDNPQEALLKQRRIERLQEAENARQQAEAEAVKQRVAEYEAAIQSGLFQPSKEAQQQYEQDRVPFEADSEGYAVLKKEQHATTPVAESQAPSTSEQGDASVATGRSGGVPEIPTQNPPQQPETTTPEGTEQPQATPEGQSTKGDVKTPTVKPAKAKLTRSEAAMKRRQHDPKRDSLNVFVAKMGGVADNDGHDLSAIFETENKKGIRGIFSPIFGAQIAYKRAEEGKPQKGRSLDKMRELAEEAGYLPEGSAATELIDYMQRDYSDDRIFTSEGHTYEAERQMKAEQAKATAEEKADRLRFGKDWEIHAAAAKEAQDYINNNSATWDNIDVHAIFTDEDGGMAVAGVKSAKLSYTDREELDNAIRESEERSSNRTEAKPETVPDRQGQTEAPEGSVSQRRDTRLPEAGTHAEEVARIKAEEEKKRKAEKEAEEKRREEENARIPESIELTAQKSKKGKTKTKPTEEPTLFDTGRPQIELDRIKAKEPQKDIEPGSLLDEEGRESAKRQAEIADSDLQSFYKNEIAGKPKGESVPDINVVLGELSDSAIERLKLFIPDISSKHKTVRYPARALKHTDEQRHEVLAKIISDLPAIVTNPVEILHNPTRKDSAFIVYQADKNNLIIVEIVKNKTGTDVVNIITTGDRQLGQYRRKSQAWLDGRRFPSSGEPKAPAEGEFSDFQPSSDTEIVDQAGKKAKHNTEDAGEELVANRRNYITTGLKWEDIADKEAALRVREVVKAKVYPRPDYQAMIDNGMHPAIAHIVKQVYDSISTKPQGRGVTADADMQKYIESVNHIMDKTMAWATDKSKAVEWVDAMTKRAARYSSSFATVARGKDVVTPYNEIFPDGWQADRGTLIIAGGNKVLSVISPGLTETRKAMNAVKAGWPAKQEMWQKRGLKIVSGDDVNVRYYEGERNNGDKYVSVSFRIGKHTRFSRDEVFREIVDGATSENDAKVQTIVSSFKSDTAGKQLLLGKNGKIKSIHDSVNKAEDAAREAVKPKSGRGGVSDKGISVLAAEREGVERRLGGEDISSERIIETFGVKGINFGNWLKGTAGSKTAERQLHLNHIYDSLTDLAELLDIPPKAIGLNGMLGIAVGAQGKGGAKAAAAHFVPGVNEINITRESGAGSLAHEFGHALDHYFARLGGLDRRTEPFLTETGGRGATPDLRPEIIDRFREIVTAMTERPETEAEAKLKTKVMIQRSKRNVDGWLKNIRSNFMRHDTDGLMIQVDGKDVRFTDAFDAVADRIRKLDVGDGHESVGRNTHLSPALVELRGLFKTVFGRVYSIADMKSLQSNVDYAKYLESKKDAQDTHEPQTAPTDFQKDANELDKDAGGKPYWSTNLEMFARAFDAYITDKLTAIAAKNTYLSHEGRSGKTVPRGKERTKINKAFDALVKEIKTRETDQGVALYSRSKGDSVVTPFTDKELSAVVERVVSAVGERHRIETVESFDDLAALKPAIQKQADKEGHDGSEIDGLIHNGTVYLIRDNLARHRDPSAKTEEAILHEFTHGDVRALYGKEIAAELNKLWLAIGGNKGVKRIADKHGINLKEYVKSGLVSDLTPSQRQNVIMDELLAFLGQEKPSIAKRVKTILGHIRQWLRDHGFAKLAKYSESDLLAVISRARKARGEAKGDTAFMVAYHGSPHDFDAFSNKNIGTGEGAQAYGYGLYYTSKKEIAEYYRGTTTEFTGENKFRWRGQTFKRNTPVGHALGLINDRGIREAQKMAKTWIGTEKYSDKPDGYFDTVNDTVQAVDRKSEIEAVRGTIYEVELAPKESDYLLWDSPLSEQSDKAKAVLKKIQADMPTEMRPTFQAMFDSHSAGSEVYGGIGDLAAELSEDGVDNKQKAASDYLHSLGIRGIKYLDGSSRGKGEGSYNYVIFADEDVKINAKFSNAGKPDVVAELTGDEVVANGDDPVTAARLYYRKHLQSTKMQSVAGEIVFNHIGGNKIRSGIYHNPLKAKLIPAIKDIIRYGTYEGREELHKNRKDSAVAFHKFRGFVKVGDDVIEARIDVMEDSNKKLFYSIEDSKKAANVSLRVAQDKGDLKRSIAPPDINIQILSQTAHRGGLSISAGQKAIDPILRILPQENLPQIMWVNSIDEIPVDVIQDSDAARSGVGEAVYFDGVIWMVAGNIHTTTRAKQVLAHELFGHAGLRKLLGNKLNPILNQIAMQRKRNGQIEKDWNDIAELYDLDPVKDRLEIAEEVLARFSERGDTKPSFMQKTIALVKAWLRKTFGMKMKWTDNDVRNLMARAKRSIETGSAEVMQGDAAMAGQPLFSKTEKQIIIPGKAKTLEGNIRRGKQAMARVINERKDALDAMHREGLGSISFYYGKAGEQANDFQGGYGVSHIVVKRDWEGRTVPQLRGQNGEQVAMKMVEVIATGNVTGRKKSRIEIKKGDFVALLALQKDGNKETWLVTGFKQERKRGGGSSGVQRSSKAYAPQAYNDVRQEVGAPASDTGNIDEGAGDRKSLFSRRKAGGH